MFLSTILFVAFALIIIIVIDSIRFPSRTVLDNGQPNYQLLKLPNEPYSIDSSVYRSAEEESEETKEIIDFTATMLGVVNGYSFYIGSFYSDFGIRRVYYCHTNIYGDGCYMIVTPIPSCDDHIVYCTTLPQVCRHINSSNKDVRRLDYYDLYNKSKEAGGRYISDQLKKLGH